MIEILYRDSDVLVVNKPPGIVVHRSEQARDSDVAMMRARDAIGAHVWPVHRLDRQTSGALVFALSEEAARTLRTAFDEGRVDKRYLAIVRGVPPERVTVDYAIPKAEGRERVPAVTEVARVSSTDVGSLVIATPRTGRYHQVRRHMAHLRHPLACDSNYGTGWFNRHVREHAGLGRLALHAWTIALPGLEEPVVAPLPDDFREAIARLSLSLPA